MKIIISEQQLKYVIEENVNQHFDYSDALKLEKALIDEFGVTYNYRKAGYISPRGYLIDLSQGASSRTLDHRNIGHIFDDLGVDMGVYNTNDWKDSFSRGMFAALDMGFIRFLPESYMFDINIMPTQEQFQILRKIITHKNGEVILDLGLDETIDYENDTPTDYIIDGIKDFFKHNIIPKTYAESFEDEDLMEQETDLNELTQYKEGNLHLIYRDNILSVVVPNSPEASTVSCRGTKWCTNDPGMYKDIAKDNILFRFLFQDHYKLRLTWENDGGEFTWGSGGNVYKEIKGYGNPFQTQILQNDVKKYYDEIINRDFYRREKDKNVHYTDIDQNMTRAQYYKLVLHTKLDMVKQIKHIPQQAIDKVLSFHQLRKRK